MLHYVLLYMNCEKTLYNCVYLYLVLFQTGRLRSPLAFSYEFCHFFLCFVNFLLSCSFSSSPVIGLAVLIHIFHSLPFLFFSVCLGPKYSSLVYCLPPVATVRGIWGLNNPGGIKKRRSKKIKVFVQMWSYKLN